MECQEAAVFSGDISCWTDDEDAKKLDEEPLYKLVKLNFKIISLPINQFLFILGIFFGGMEMKTKAEDTLLILEMFFLKDRILMMLKDTMDHLKERKDIGKVPSPNSKR